MKTLNKIRIYISKQLEPEYGSGEAHSMTRILLEDLLNISSKESLLNPEVDITPAQEEILMKAVDRLINHEPIQYITEKAYFLDLTFKVDSSVLIPRPETEELVQHLIRDIKKTGNHQPIIIDICTGSGCIAIALQHEFPEAKIYALDVSEPALKIAKENAEKILKSNTIKFIQADILQTHPFENELSKVDYIISNPPYVTLAEKVYMQENVLAHEPHLALFVPENDPLIFYKRIAELGLKYLYKDGSIYFEINEQKGKDLLKLFDALGYNNMEVMTDISGKERMMRIGL